MSSRCYRIQNVPAKSPLPFEHCGQILAERSLSLLPNIRVDYDCTTDKRPIQSGIALIENAEISKTVTVNHSKKETLQGHAQGGAFLN